MIKQFSPFLAIAGVLSLAIAGSGFAGAQPFSWIGHLPIGWIAIVVALVIGTLMVIAPGKHKKDDPNMP